MAAPLLQPLANNVISGNLVNGVNVLSGGRAVLLHTTLAGNSTGINVEAGASAAFTNTILSHNATAVSVASGGSGRLAYTLCDANGSLGSGGTFATPCQSGAAHFAGDGYHLLPNSAAIDAGVEAGVPTDIDGEYRVRAPDLGADEYAPRSCWVRLNDDPTDYATVQAAVDASARFDDLVKVTGDCGQLARRAGLTQVVYLTKTLTLRGGYTLTNWTTPDPLHQPTVLEAHDAGRVLYIAGAITPTVEWLELRGGSAAGLGGGPGAADAGGGVYIDGAAPLLSHNLLSANRAGYGAGLYLKGSAAGLVANRVVSNTAQADGGGLYLAAGPATLTGNDVLSNTALSGGGLYLSGSAATLSGNRVRANQADYGGGLFLASSPATLTGNSVISNTAFNGAGLLLSGASHAVVTANTVSGNVAGGTGGGLYLAASDRAVLDGNIFSANRAAEGGGLLLSATHARLVNTVVIRNHADQTGAGLRVLGASPALQHTTVANNDGGDGSGISIPQFTAQDTGAASGGAPTGPAAPTLPSSVALTNTIVANKAVGVATGSNASATLNGVLWYANGADTSGPGIAVAHAVGGNPAFDRDGYHLLSGSAAINVGVVAGVISDVDGQARDATPDPGADEYVRTCWVRLNNSPTDYLTVQAAVNAGTHVTDVVKVAGTCSGLSDPTVLSEADAGLRPSASEPPFPAAVAAAPPRQQVKLARTLTLRGGYTVTNWTAPDPLAHPTTLDARGQGRVLYVSGHITPTVEGLSLVRGSAEGLGGDPIGIDAGGAVYVLNATLTLSNCHVLDSAATYGGGAYLWGSNAFLRGSTFAGNSAYSGGGLFLLNSPATLLADHVSNNRAEPAAGGMGGGIYINNSVTTDPVALERVSVVGNAAYAGGGLHLNLGAATLRGSDFSLNHAAYAGGVYLYHTGPRTALDAATVGGNVARWGGGLVVEGGAPVVTNTVIFNNQATLEGAGIWVIGADPSFAHTTLSHNIGPGAGVVVRDWRGAASHAGFTNSIVANHAQGVNVYLGNAVTLNGVLWYANPGGNLTGAGIKTASHEYSGDPSFAADGYHLQSGSAAIDRGVAAGVPIDIDGQARDAQPDLGADELGAAGPDVTPPAAVADLASFPGPGTNQVRLSWSAPGDDGSGGGPATLYDIRYSSGPITAGNWSQASVLPGAPLPATPGTGQEMLVSGLAPGTMWSFALRAVDEAGNWSGLSYVPALLHTGMRPNPNGYSFGNYGGKNPRDYTLADQRRMFGDACVCRSLANGVCVPTATATEWNRWVNAQMVVGHCVGLAISSQRFMAGLDTPGAIQPGAITAWDLSQANARRNIAYQWVLQYTSLWRNYPSVNNPTLLLIKLINALTANPLNPYVAALAPLNLYGGHTVALFAVQDRRPGVFWVWVYDSNWPGSPQHIEFDVVHHTCVTRRWAAA